MTAEQKRTPPCPIKPGLQRVSIQGVDRAKVERVEAKAVKPLGWPELHDYFDAVYVLSLARREDRRQAFKERLKDWPFREPQTLAGVDARWIVMGGNSAAACAVSHLRALHQAIIDGHQRILILEDDCELTDDFTPTVAQFLASVPDDWECLMLGGNLFDESQQVDCGHGVRRVSHCEMLHCYALQGDAIKSLADYWSMTVGHCDHRIAEWQDAGHVTYAPSRWIAGQAEGMSDIVCHEMPKRLFDDRTVNLPKAKATPHNTAVVTVACYPADEVDARIGLLKRSAEFFGVELDILGTGERYGSHYSAKVLRLGRWLKSLDKPFVFFVDARDVLFNGGMLEICAAINKGDGKVIFGTESNCAPDAGFERSYDPKLHCRNYVNSGVFGGPTAEVINMIGAMAQAYAARPEDKHRDNDQHLVQVIRSEGYPIALDHDGRLAANLYGMDRATPPNSQFELHNGRVRWRDNKVSPAVIHWNGLGGDEMADWWKAISE